MKLNLQRDLILAATAAAVFLRLGKLVEAAEIVAQAKESLRKRSAHLDYERPALLLSCASLISIEAEFHARAGRLDHALQLCDQGKQCCDASGTEANNIRNRLLTVRATILLDMDRPAEALDACEACKNVMQMQSLRAEALFQLGRLEECRAVSWRCLRVPRATGGQGAKQPCTCAGKDGRGPRSAPSPAHCSGGSCSDALMMTHLSRNYEILSGNLSLY